MAYEKLIKRTIYQASCECGFKEAREDNPPREVQCANCKRWLKFELKFEPISWTGPDTYGK